MKGYLSSIESFSTLDGPGIRSVVFLQGCPLRCLYCHNPESWIGEKGLPVESSYIIERILRNSAFISDGGGVTISGGEPTFQIDFLKEILSRLKAEGIHTAVDTSGYVTLEDVQKIEKFTDLFIIDIKHMDCQSCEKLTGKSNRRALELIEYLNSINKDVWIRCVMVPSLTDNEEHIIKLSQYVKKFDNITRFEILPYHDMARSKYDKLNIKYPLSNMKGYNTIELRKLKDCFAKHYGRSIVI